MEIGDSKVKIHVKKDGQKDETRRKYSMAILQVPVSLILTFITVTKTDVFNDSFLGGHKSYA